MGGDLLRCFATFITSLLDTFITSLLDTFIASLLDTFITSLLINSTYSDSGNFLHILVTL